MTKTEESLFLCLQYAQIDDLPPVLDAETRFWKYAIGKVLSKNGGTFYAILRQDNNGVNVFKSFGFVTIAKIEIIYPYSFVGKALIPKNRTREEFIKIISEFYEIEPKRLAKVSDKKIFGLFMGYVHAIDRHEKEIHQIENDYDAKRKRPNAGRSLQKGTEQV